MKRLNGGADWVYSVLPVNIALGPVGTFVQLYILVLHGTVIDIGLASTLFNAVSIPAAMVWGYATDHSQSRKVIIVGSYVALAANLVLFTFAGTIHGVELFYALFSFLSSASATPLNLLIMETEPKPKWASTFSRLSMVSSVGTSCGLVLGVGWADYLPLNLMVMPLAALSLVAAALSLVMLEEPRFVFEEGIIVMIRRSFFVLLLAVPMLFLRIPRIFDFRKTLRGLRYELTRDTQVLYLSIIAFYVASGIFNTSLVPSQFNAHLSKSQIFLVSLVGMIVQVIAFRYTGPYIEKRNLRKAAIAGLGLRSASYAIIGLAAYSLTGMFYLGANLILFPIAGGVAFALYYSASNVMIFHSLDHTGQGSALGVYSALVGLASTLGAFISGFTSFYFGYYSTFILAATLLAVAAWLTSLLQPSETWAQAPAATS